MEFLTFICFVLSVQLSDLWRQSIKVSELLIALKDAEGLVA